MQKLRFPSDYLYDRYTPGRRYSNYVMEIDFCDLSRSSTERQYAYDRVRYQHNIFRREVRDSFVSPLVCVVALQQYLNCLGTQEFINIPLSIPLGYMGWIVLAEAFCEAYKLYNMFVGLLISDEYDAYRHWDALSGYAKQNLSETLYLGTAFTLFLLVGFSVVSFS